MITGLETDFLNNLSSTNSSPVSLLEFTVGSVVYYLSDRPIGIAEGLSHDYSPWIESFGELKDNASLDDFNRGGFLEARTMSITLLVSPVSRSFVQTLFASGVENTKVELYQWYKGMTTDPVFVDVFVCQDPIKISEKSMLLDIDLVSTLMATDPYLWSVEEGKESRPVVIGKATSVPLMNLQTARSTTIEQDITYDFTGAMFIGNGIGFASTGTLTIDSEDITYTSITASEVTISARAQNGTTARPHIRGAKIFPYGATFDYAICAGPVSSVDNLLANGETYQNDVTFYPGQNPVIARFVGREPWLKVAAGQDGDPIEQDPVTDSEYGASTAYRYGNGAGAPSNVANVNSASGSATMNISSTTGGASGSYSKYPTTVIQSGFTGSTDQADWTMASLASDGSDYTLSGCEVGIFDDQVATNADAYYQYQYGYNDSAYGNCTSVTAEIQFYNGQNTIMGCQVQVSVYKVNSSNGLTLLKTWTHDTRGTYTAVNASWNNYKITSNLGITSFSELQNTKIRVYMKMLDCDTKAESSNKTHRCDVSVSSVKFTIGYYTPAGSYPTPYQGVTADFNRDLSSLGAINSVTVKSNFSVSLSNAKVDIRLYRRFTSSTTGAISLYTTTRTSSLGTTTITSIIGALTWAQLAELRIELFHQIVGPNTDNTTRVSNALFNYVVFEITYTPDDVATPDEERVVYADTLVCDVTSTLGEDPTPAEVIETFLDSHSSCSPYLNSTSFAAAHALYDADSFYFNGLLEANIKLHAAIRIFLKEGMCRLLFNQGEVKIIPYYDTPSTTPDMTITDYSLKSKELENQPTSAIKNDITVLYDKDYSIDAYNGKLTSSDATSISNFGNKEYRQELTLVNDESTAQIHADRLLEMMQDSVGLLSMDCYMDTFVLEKGDIVSTKSLLNSSEDIVGSVISLSRIFGSGKNSTVNKIKVYISVN